MPSISYDKDFSLSEDNIWRENLVTAWIILGTPIYYFHQRKEQEEETKENNVC